MAADATVLFKHTAALSASSDASQFSGRPRDHTHYAPQLGTISHKAIAKVSKDKFVGKTAAFLPLPPFSQGGKAEKKRQICGIVSKSSRARSGKTPMLFNDKTVFRPRAAKAETRLDYAALRNN
ncbi:hypothetical protein [Lentibacter sp.]|uniref:hypothetical protein n=1 Tax=Lentibacter sp. TaxID=2024994 RepID=UPI003F699268